MRGLAPAAAGAAMRRFEGKAFPSRVSPSGPLPLSLSLSLPHTCEELDARLGGGGGRRGDAAV